MVHRMVTEGQVEEEEVVLENDSLVLLKRIWIKNWKIS